MDKALYRSQTSESLLSIAVLFVMLLLTYGILIAAPYSGFYFNPTNGQIEIVYSSVNSTLKEGDRVEQIGAVSLAQFKSDRRLVMFQGAGKGDPIIVVVTRKDKQIAVTWVFPGFTLQEFANRLFDSWISGYAFWLAGFAAQLSIRPRDRRRRLFIIANYLTALFLVSGSLSSRHLWESSTLLHMSSWLMMPIFLQLHWEFPRPLGKTSKLFWSLFYAIATLLVLGEAAHIMGRNLYALGFLATVMGSIAFLFAHLVIHKDQRRVVGMLLLSIFIAFSSSLASALAVALGVVVNLGWFTVFSMPFMPLAYFYIIYRRHLGDMEAKVNRIISTYFFLIILSVAVFITVVLAIRAELAQESWFALAMLLSLASIIVTAISLPHFQMFVNQRFFSITLPYQHLPETYSSRIAASDNLTSLLTLLEHEVFPSLLIRQYAFLRSQDKVLSALLAKDILDETFDFDLLSQKAGAYLPPLPPDPNWTRLILPLKVGDNILGFWLLGKRDPDDLYPQVEIPILQSLADQTAIALSNILNSEQLRTYYQADLETIANERIRISRDLHDNILGRLAHMRNSLDQKILPPTFLSAYDDLKKRLREIIRDLRPPLLDQGLFFAINDMVEDLREKHESTNILLNTMNEGARFPGKVEEHLFHIVHEACENALKHSNCRTLTISGSISPGRVDLSIRDDGAGFDPNADHSALIANRHFGLVGMKERAHLIGAELEIKSQPGSGTIIHISWMQKN